MSVTVVPADVVTWMAADASTIDDDTLDRAFVAAVGALEDDYDLDVADPDRADLAVVMYAARLYRRKNSINGIEAASDWGPLRVSITDPDIHRLLARWETVRFG